MKDLLISIVTPNFNSEKYISKTIESVQAQTYTNWEMVIIDDCSSDNSVAIIKRYMKTDTRIRLIELTENLGPAASRNAGIEIVKGTYLTFIDSDDLWMPHFLEISIQNIQNSDGFVFASYHRFDENLQPYFKDFVVPKKVNYTDILETNSISCLTAFIDIQKLGKMYMPNVRYRQDMGLWLQYLQKIPFAVGIQEPLAIYRIRKKSHSRNKINLISHQWNFYRKVAKLSILNSLKFILLWILNGLKKYYL